MRTVTGSEKLYPDSAVRVLEYKEDWVKIQSGDA